MPEVDARAIAARLRSLIAGPDAPPLEDVARRLGVGEVSLRLSIHDVSPQPTFEVLIAVVRYYGVDPVWLVTGEYNLMTHRQAADGSAEQLRDHIKSLFILGPLFDGGHDEPPREIEHNA